MKREVERSIEDSIADIISIVVDNSLPRTADALREAQLLMLLEVCQDTKTGVMSK